MTENALGRFGSTGGGEISGREVGKQLEIGYAPDSESDWGAQRGKEGKG